MKKTIPAKHPRIKPAGLAAGPNEKPNATTVKAMRDIDRVKAALNTPRVRLKPPGPSVDARIVEGLEEGIATVQPAPALEPYRWPDDAGYVENHFHEWCWIFNGATMCGRSPLGGGVATAIPPDGLACILCNIRKLDLEARRGQ